MRRWRKELLDSRASPTSVAKAYRLLKAVLSTAVDDGIIRRNPCRIRGAGQDGSPERRTLTVRQVGQLATATHPRYSALVLLMFQTCQPASVAGRCLGSSDDSSRVPACKSGSPPVVMALTWAADCPRVTVVYRW